jgi:hypothetical protein
LDADKYDKKVDGGMLNHSVEVQYTDPFNRWRQTIPFVIWTESLCGYHGSSYLESANRNTYNRGQIE